MKTARPIHPDFGFLLETRERCSKTCHQLLTGTGNLIRHIDVKKPADYRNPFGLAEAKNSIYKIH